jgi:hypothetical protein
MSEQTTTKASPSLRFSPDTWSLEVWAVAASVIFIALVVAGIFPRVPW